MFHKTFKSIEFDFKQISFDPFESSDVKIFQDDRDPDLDYFDEINIPGKKRINKNQTDIKIFLHETQWFDSVSVLHVNTRELKINFQNFHNLLKNTGSSFNIVCLTETWCSNSEIINSSHFDIDKYKAISFERKENKRWGSILNYIKTDLMYNIRKDLSVSN